MVVGGGNGVMRVRDGRIVNRSGDLGWGNLGLGLVGWGVGLLNVVLVVIRAFLDLSSRLNRGRGRVGC